MVPVVVGTAVAYNRLPSRWGAGSWGAAGLALAVALCMQIGVNYANDYSDGLRGSDSERVGPVRLVASGLATAPAVKRAAMACFGASALCGLALSAWRAPWLIAVGAVCIAAGWLYTGGPKPYGYAGFGELAVFVFFGVVATVGTTFVVAEHFYLISLVAAFGVGTLAVALLVVNNLRDIVGDERSSKRTLAVRLGDRRTRILYVACISSAFVAAGATAETFAVPWSWLAFVVVFFAVRPLRSVLGGATGTSLLPVLGMTARVQMLYGLALTLGIAVSR